ncbi:MAG: hypothetical protein ACJA2S_003884 [Cyclobacteriaceae bacterium]|jgi:hypothetical protein|tara:strand:+ start:59 stop:229 length:171 start_codon:yes stop_codon:yes gene_type:complete
MVTVIKKGDSKANIRKALQKIEEKDVKGFDAKKYCGILKLKEDPLEIQKRMRNEWE